MGSVVVSGVKFVFLGSFVLRLTSLLLIHRLAEPEAKGVRHVVRVLRNVKIQSLMEGLPALQALRRESRARRIPVPHFIKDKKPVASTAGREHAKAA